MKTFLQKWFTGRSRKPALRVTLALESLEARDMMSGCACSLAPYAPPSNLLAGASHGQTVQAHVSYPTDPCYWL